MAVKGLWNVGGFNLPDFGVSEFFGVGPKNSAIVAPQASKYMTGGGVPGAVTNYLNNTPTAVKPTATNTYTPQITTGGRGGGGGGQPQTPQSTGSGGGISANGQYWSSMQDYQNDEARARQMGYGSAAELRMAEQQRQQEDMINQQVESAYGPARERIMNQFAPEFQNLSAMEENYRAQFPTAQTELEQSYGQILPELQRAQQTNLGGIQEQQRTGEQEKKSQIEQARQLYNELRQGRLTRFGGASSTGEAAQELLGRQAATQFGDINKRMGDFQVKLAQEESNVNNYYQERKTQLEQEKQLKIQQMKDTFDSKIREINSARSNLGSQQTGALAELESQKAARRLASLQEYTAQIRQANIEAANFARDLDLWKQYKDEVLKSAKDFRAQSFTIPGFKNMFGSVQMELPKATAPIQGYNFPSANEDERLRLMGLQPIEAAQGKIKYGKPKDDISALLEEATL